MKLKVKPLNIVTGGILEAELNKEDAMKLDIHPGDRIEVKTKNGKKTTAIVEITESREYTHENCIRPCMELTKELRLREGMFVDIKPQPRPQSVSLIKKKLRGERLSESDIRVIINDIAENKLSTIETTYFVAACYMHELSMRETVDLTRAMINNGNKLKLLNRTVVDKHCIGGVAGNRTTMVVVPIIAAAGLTIPKTSSRAITSPSGTADTMEVLCDVEFPFKKMKRLVEKVGGCIVWGGGDLGLAPADDKIIRVEHPVSLDPTGQLLASIIAKKVSVSSRYLVIDIPVGEGSKMEDKKRARQLKSKFMRLTHEMGIKTKVIFTDGSRPIGKGIGPVLEARDVMWVLMNDPRAPKDLLEKSVKVAGELLEMAGKAKKNHGKWVARNIILSGKAWKKFNEIIDAQGRKIDSVEELVPAQYMYHHPSPRTGKIVKMHNKLISKLARIAGAPMDPHAGVYLYKNVRDKVARGEEILTIYSNSMEKLEYAKALLSDWKNGILVE